MKMFVVYTHGNGWGDVLEGIFTKEEYAKKAIENIQQDEEYMEPGMMCWMEEEWTDPIELIYKSEEE